MQARIDGFIRAADEIAAAYWKQNNFTYCEPPTHRADFISEKWCRVVTMELRNGVPQSASVYAFIAMMDFANKALGQVQAGDIHKPSSFRVPAKHARGSILADDFGKSCLTSHGPKYLK